MLQCPKAAFQSWGKSVRPASTQHMGPHPTPYHLTNGSTCVLNAMISFKSTKITS